MSIHNSIIQYLLISCNHQHPIFYTLKVRDFSATDELCIRTKTECMSVDKVLYNSYYNYVGR